MKVAYGKLAAVKELILLLEPLVAFRSPADAKNRVSAHEIDRLFPNLEPIRSAAFLGIYKRHTARTLNRNDSNRGQDQEKQYGRRCNAPPRACKRDDKDGTAKARYRRPGRGKNQRRDYQAGARDQQKKRNGLSKRKSHDQSRRKRGEELQYFGVRLVVTRQVGDSKLPSR